MSSRPQRFCLGEEGGGSCPRRPPPGLRKARWRLQPGHDRFLSSLTRLPLLIIDIGIDTHLQCALVRPAREGLVPIMPFKPLFISNEGHCSLLIDPAYTFR